jgi:hypothetical protein
VLRELALDYATDGIELDFSASPGAGPVLLRPEEPWASKSFTHAA